MASATIVVDLITKQNNLGGFMSCACKTCGKETVESGHLYVPVRKKDSKCDWCGLLLMDERHMCSSKIKELSYICNSCGRLAVSDKYLCNPRKIN
ncbi:MAG: hypothetical protein ABIA97_02075 [Candidatus Omnitrophota bacterium]